MKDIISTTRTLNLYYHHLHNIAHGLPFEGDHEMMSRFYTQLEGSYDSLIERYMGLGADGGKECLIHILSGVVSVISQIPEGNDMDVHFRHALELESGIQSMLEAEAESSSLGTENLLAQLADESESRVYKLNQRLK